MRWHVKTVHADDETTDDGDNPESTEDDDVSDKADNVELKIQNIQDDSDYNVEDGEEEEEQEEEEGKEEDSDDLWCLLIEQAFERCQWEFDERVTEYLGRQR